MPSKISKESSPQERLSPMQANLNEISARPRGDFEAWLAGLPALLTSMDLSSVRRA